MSDTAVDLRTQPANSWLDHPLVQLTLLRIREFVREPEAVFWAVLFPILLAAGLGIAFQDRPDGEVKIAVMSPELAAHLRLDRRITVEELSPDQASEALRTGKVVLLAEAAADGGVAYRYDDTNPDARLARLLVDSVVQSAAGRTDPVPASDQLIREPGSRYIDFLVPGMIGMGIMSNAVWGLAFSIVDARRRKLLKRIIATPMPRHYYLLSFLMMRLMMLGIEVGVPLGFGMLAFGVPMRGSFVALLLVSVIGSLTFSSLGLLIATRVRTIEAASGLTNLVLMPMWILSGVFFSAERFPEVIQPAIRLLPLTALNDALREVSLRGSALGALTPELALLGVWMAVCFVAALKLFRWR
jgi:ABC-type polysaccharide/polyol phosphate export permease